MFNSGNLITNHNNYRICGVYDHAMVIVWYDFIFADSIDHRFMITNSHGSEWGDLGYGHVGIGCVKLVVVPKFEFDDKR